MRATPHKTTAKYPPKPKFSSPHKPKHKVALTPEQKKAKLADKTAKLLRALAFITNLAPVDLASAASFQLIARLISVGLSTPTLSLGII